MAKRGAFQRPWAKQCTVRTPKLRTLRGYRETITTGPNDASQFLSHRVLWRRSTPGGCTTHRPIASTQGKATRAGLLEACVHVLDQRYMSAIGRSRPQTPSTRAYRTTPSPIWSPDGAPGTTTIAQANFPREEPPQLPHPFVRRPFHKLSPQVPLDRGPPAPP